MVHTGGTYVCMEGPQFSTLAESKLYRSWGADIIGMTNLQEAKLAREAEICYSTIALVTDYDCWHPDHDSVTVDIIIANLMQNAKTAQHIIAAAVESLPFERTCECASALKYALITRPDAIPASGQAGSGADSWASTCKPPRKRVKGSDPKERTADEQRQVRRDCDRQCHCRRDCPGRRRPARRAQPAEGRR